jgi:endogenous inhibitor of DNA gyrase (YacG/DUF329 family)
MAKEKVAYCPNCRKPIEKPKREKYEGFHLHIIILIIISTLGFALIPFLIYHFFIRPKKFCPDCGKRVDFYDSPEDFPPPKIPPHNLLERVERERKEKEEREKLFQENTKRPSPIRETEYIKCPNCSRRIEKESLICEYCGVDLSKESFEE